MVEAVRREIESIPDLSMRAASFVFGPAKLFCRLAQWQSRGEVVDTMPKQASGNNHCAGALIGEDFLEQGIPLCAADDVRAVNTASQ